MDNVSIQEMRFEFGKIKAGLKNGRTYVLTYRNKPLATLIPIQDSKVKEDDSALAFGIEAVDIEPMTNQDMDKAIYG
ncbi:MAG: type II toxin-antitoxin system Phd/YefM family antitoxin [Candidatus Methylacidiphilales bacterium]